MRVDLNCDLGEGAGHDAELMPLITSANIACGAHAGDEAMMRELVALAARHGVEVGAHPGYADRENFGRREMRMSRTALHELVRCQIVRLCEMGPVRHVKPHGALYNLAARDRAVADVIAEVVWEVDPAMVLFALAGSELVKAGRARGLVVAQEVFADRSYQPDGSLTPRTKADALLSDERAVVRQVLQMVQTGAVRATDGSEVKITADTICLHGDGPSAVRFAAVLRRELVAHGIAVRAFGLV
jgi:UPF0271 protein